MKTFYGFRSGLELFWKQLSIQRHEILPTSLRIDFGPLGIKTSSAQITKNYQPDELVGLQISAVLNFPAKRVAGFKSEVLVLGAYSEEKGVVLLTPTDSVENDSLVG